LLQAEDYWTQLIEFLPDEAALWSNRGNVRASQNKLTLKPCLIMIGPLNWPPMRLIHISIGGQPWKPWGSWEAAISDYTQSA
jgi:hypothetical protein